MSHCSIIAKLKDLKERVDDLEQNHVDEMDHDDLQAAFDDTKKDVEKLMALTQSRKVQMSKKIISYVINYVVMSILLLTFFIERFAFSATFLEKPNGEKTIFVAEVELPVVDDAIACLIKFNACKPIKRVNLSTPLKAFGRVGTADVPGDYNFGLTQERILVITVANSIADSKELNKELTGDFVFTIENAELPIKVPDQLILLSRCVPSYTQWGDSSLKFAGWSFEECIYRTNAAQLPVITLTDNLFAFENLLHASYPPSEIFDPEACVDPELTPLLHRIYGASTPTRNSHLPLKEILSKRTIQGVPLLDVLYHLSTYNGMYNPVAIVGGAVRDALMEVPARDICDIDIVVALPYKQLIHILKAFFTTRGKSFESALIATPGYQKYGQLKIAATAVEKEPLDIAMFKSHRLTSAEKTQFASNADYLFGWSYVDDAKSRDFTFNALYFQFFPKQLLIDPTGYGIKDCREKIIRIANTVDFADDLGGNFRYWRFLIKEYSPSDAGQPSQVNQNIINYFRDRSKGSLLAFYSKMQKKFIKDALTMEDTLRGIVEILHKSLAGAPTWLSEVSKLADLQQARSEFYRTGLFSAETLLPVMLAALEQYSECNSRHI